MYSVQTSHVLSDRSAANPPRCHPQRVNEASLLSASRPNSPYRAGGPAKLTHPAHGGVLRGRRSIHSLAGCAANARRRSWPRRVRCDSRPWSIGRHAGSGARRRGSDRSGPARQASLEERASEQASDPGARRIPTTRVERAEEALCASLPAPMPRLASVHPKTW